MNNYIKEVPKNLQGTPLTTLANDIRAIIPTVPPEISDYLEPITNKCLEYASQLDGLQPDLDVLTASHDELNKIVENQRGTIATLGAQMVGARTDMDTRKQEEQQQKLDEKRNALDTKLGNFSKGVY